MWTREGWCASVTKEKCSVKRRSGTQPGLLGGGGCQVTVAAQNEPPPLVLSPEQPPQHLIDVLWDSCGKHFSVATTGANAIAAVGVSRSSPRSGTVAAIADVVCSLLPCSLCSVGSPRGRGPLGSLSCGLQSEFLFVDRASLHSSSVRLHVPLCFCFLVLPQLLQWM